MKNLITTIGSVLVLFVFLMQFVANQNTYSRVLGVECAVRRFCAEAEACGEITEEAVSELRNSVSSALKCSPGQVEINMEPAAEPSTEPSAEPSKQSVRVIRYEVSFPLRNIIGGAKILKLSDEENSATGFCRGLIHLIGGDD